MNHTDRATRPTIRLIFSHRSFSPIDQILLTTAQMCDENATLRAKPSDPSGGCWSARLRAVERIHRLADVVENDRDGISARAVREDRGRSASLAETPARGIARRGHCTDRRPGGESRAGQPPTLRPP